MLDTEFDRLLTVCRIQLSEEERPKIKKDIEEIIEYFNTLDTLDVKETDAAYHPVPIKGKMRNDKLEEFPDINLILSNTKTYRFYVVGPKA